MAAAGIGCGSAWAVAVGSRPQAVAGSFDLPVLGLALVLCGLFVWMAGMARHERAQATEWRKLYARRMAPAPAPRVIAEPAGAVRVTAAPARVAQLAPDPIRVRHVRPRTAAARAPSPAPALRAASAETWS